MDGRYAWYKIAWFLVWGLPWMLVAQIARCLYVFSILMWGNVRMAQRAWRDTE